MRDLTLDQTSRNHPNHLATFGEHRFRERAHQSDACAAIYHTDAPACTFAAEITSRRDETIGDAVRRAAKNANGTNHAVAS